MSFFGEAWDYPQDYVDRVRAAGNNGETVMDLNREAMEHGDLFAYTRAVRDIFKEDALARIRAAEFDSMTWSDVVGGAIFEPIVYPYILYFAHEYAVLKEGQLTEAVTEAWTLPEWPEQYLETAIWIELFNETGFIGDTDEPTPPSTEPMVLWRGATEDRKYGMSWTEKPYVANWFARRFAGSLQEKDRPVKVFRATFPPEALLAHFTERGEFEWVVDAEWLEDGGSELAEFEIDSLPEFKKPVQVGTVADDLGEDA